MKIKLLIVFAFVLTSTFSQNVNLDLNFSLGISPQDVVSILKKYSNNEFLYYCNGNNFFNQNRKLSKFDSQGNRISTFYVGPITGDVKDIGIQSDGKIILAGNFNKINGINAYNLARLNTNGSLDTTFNPVYISGSLESLLILNDDRILISGSTGSMNLDNLFLLSSNGEALSSNFNTNLGRINGFASEMLLLEDGDILITGNFSTYTVLSQTTGAKILRLNSDGTRDQTFSNIGSNVTTIYTMAVANNYLYCYPGYGKIRKYNLDTGNQISSFETGVFGFDYVFKVSKIITQPDGKLIVGGVFDGYDNYSNVHDIMRLNTNGTLDYNFSILPDNSVSDLMIDNNSLYISGSFQNIGSTSINNVAKFNSDSFLDVEYPVNDILEDKCNIYPNPTLNSWKITTSKHIESVELFDLVGRKILSKNPMVKDFEVEASFLPSGVYTMIINKKNVFRLIKE
jgi:uncharacterized delta-60 repeat protein